MVEHPCNGSVFMEWPCSRNKTDNKQVGKAWPIHL